METSSLLKKLKIKAGQKVLILNAPEGYMQLLGDLPEGVELETSPEGTYDFVQIFLYSKADVDRYTDTALKASEAGAFLWLAYPKKSSGIKSDLSRDSNWESILAVGLRPVTQIAIDETWSALRFRPVSEVKSKHKG